MFIVDAHLDLAYNALRFGRDLKQTVAAVREFEEGTDLPNGRATVTLPGLREAGVCLVFGTLFAGPASNPTFASDEKFVYRTNDEAHQAGQEQLDYYHRLADDLDYVRLVGSAADLDEVLASHDGDQDPLLGIVPLMEGADPIRQPAEAEIWYERGLRIIGLAWDDTQYCPGAWRGRGGLTRLGRRLLNVMADLGFILDLTHMSEEASLQALDEYQGTVIASHSNVRALVPGQRQLNDVQIRQLAQRDGVIGIALCNSFLRAGHRLGDPKESVTLSRVVAHVDHVCQLTGNSSQVGIGSDLDGGFGARDIPSELDDVADLPLIGQALTDQGYSTQDVYNVMGGNWLRLLHEAFNT